MHKILGILLCSMILLAAMFVVDGRASSASAASAKSQGSKGAAVSCFGQAIPFAHKDIKVGPGVSPSTPNKTSSHCRDINVKFTKLTNPIQLRICFTRFKPDKCNVWKFFNKNDVGRWRVVATNVLNGVEYRFDIKATKTTTFQGLLAD